jgi:hypothetical protein
MFPQRHLAKALCDSLIYILKMFGTAFRDDQTFVSQHRGGYIPETFPTNGGVRVRAHVSPSSICALVLAGCPPSSKSRWSLKLSTRRCFLTHALRCGHACHSRPPHTPTTTYSLQNSVPPYGCVPRYSPRSQSLTRLASASGACAPLLHHSMFSSPPRLALSLHSLPSFALLHLHPHLLLPSYRC